MNKNVLFVVDERCMGGVSILLSDMLNMIDLTNLNVDVLVLHDRGDMLTDLPESVNVIYGTPYFSAIDLSIKEVIKSKNIKTMFRKFMTVFDMKTGLVKNKIIRERKKILKKHYDYEIAFKDGYTALFTAYGDSDIKYHWIQYDYGTGNPNAKYPNLFNEVLPTFDKIISVSDGVANDFNNIYHLEDKVEIIDNLINVDKIKEKSLEQCDVELDNNKINIICVGRLLNAHKGFDRLIDAIDKLNKDNLFNDCILRIYGDGPDKETIHKQIMDYKLNDKIKLCGRVNNPFKYYKGNDLFILPSRYEAFGLVIVEAMVLGVPALVTKNGATAKLVKDGFNGKIVENTDEGIYLGLRELLVNKETLKSYKENLINYEYDNKRIIESIESLFK